MKKIILILTCLFICENVFSQNYSAEKLKEYKTENMEAPKNKDLDYVDRIRGFVVTYHLDNFGYFTRIMYYFFYRYDEDYPKDTFNIDKDFNYVKPVLFSFSYCSEDLDKVLNIYDEFSLFLDNHINDRMDFYKNFIKEHQYFDYKQIKPRKDGAIEIETDYFDDSMADFRDN